jgi:hypothetical protein
MGMHSPAKSLYGRNAAIHGSPVVHRDCLFIERLYPAFDIPRSEWLDIGFCHQLAEEIVFALVR